MIISIEKARKIMGPANKNYTDTELEEIINILVVLSDIAIDSYIEKQKKLKGGDKK